DDALQHRRVALDDDLDIVGPELVGIEFLLQLLRLRRGFLIVAEAELLADILDEIEHSQVSYSVKAVARKADWQWAATTGRRLREVSVLVHPAAHLLHRRTPRLFLEPSVDGAPGRFRLLARRRRGLGRLGDQGDESLAGVRPVLLLGAETGRLENDDAVLRGALAGKLEHALAHAFRQSGRILRVETQLHGGRHLVDVLPTRTGGTDEGFREIARMDGDAGRHL